MGETRARVRAFRPLSTNRLKKLEKKQIFMIKEGKNRRYFIKTYGWPTGRVFTTS